MKVSDYIIRFLHAQGVTHVYEVVGGMIAHLIDSAARLETVQLVSVHHEQTGAFAADATGRLTGTPGVALATSGPGATNLLTGIGSCYFDSSPAVFLTGQVNRKEQKGDRPIRQLGFQETDVIGVARPLVKGAWAVNTPEDVSPLLVRAFELAGSGRPGPVLLDIPMDVQGGEVPDTVPPRVTVPVPDVDPASVRAVLAGLARAERPLILAGGGIRAAGAAGLLRAFVEAAQVPVVYSLLGVDAMPTRHPMRVGMIGTYGNRWANLAIGRTDCMLVLGSRLDIRQTGALTEAFKGGRPVYHIDIEPGEINNRVTGCEPVVAHLRAFLESAVAEAASASRDRAEWITELKGLRRAWPDTAELAGVPGINPNALMHEVSRHAQAASAFVADVGQHQMWAAQSLDLEADQRFLTSGGMGAMGFGLPAAIGAAFVAPGRPVVLVAGDGGFQLNIQELQTVVRNRLPVKMVILNNQAHGMMRQFQETYFAQRYHSSYWGYSAPDFTRVADAYGMAAATIEDPADVPGAIERLWADPKAPFLLHVLIHPFANAYPKIAFGRPITEMEPLASPVELEGA